MRSGLFFARRLVVDSHCLTAEEVIPLRPVNAKPEPGLDWHKVTAIEIKGVEDTHG